MITMKHLQIYQISALTNPENINQPNQYMLLKRVKQ